MTALVDGVSLGVRGNSGMQVEGQAEERGCSRRLRWLSCRNLLWSDHNFLSRHSGRIVLQEVSIGARQDRYCSKRTSQATLAHAACETGASVGLNMDLGMHL
jgi:hypothetical protein